MDQHMMIRELDEWIADKKWDPALRDTAMATLLGFYVGQHARQMNKHPGGGLMYLSTLMAVGVQASHLTDTVKGTVKGMVDAFDMAEAKMAGTKS